MLGELPGVAEHMPPAGAAWDYAACRPRDTSLDADRLVGQPLFVAADHRLVADHCHASSWTSLDVSRSLHGDVLAPARAGAHNVAPHFAGTPHDGARAALLVDDAAAVRADTDGPFLHDAAAHSDAAVDDSFHDAHTRDDAEVAPHGACP